MENILIIYYSGTGNTKKMAEEIRNGILKTDNTVTLINLQETTPHINGFHKIMFGCPPTGKELLERTLFMPFLESIHEELKDIDVALFGSYGWGKGEWMDTFEEYIKSSKANVFGSLIIQGTPDDNDSRCLNFGEQFANK